MAEQAGERTEEATPHRLRKAREQGNVPKSQDVNVVVIIVALIGVLFALGKDDIRQLATQQIKLISLVRLGEWSSDTAVELLVGLLQDTLLLLGPLMLVLVVAALVVNVAQTGPVISTTPFQPDFTRLNPVNGLKRIFSLKGLFDGVKGMVKLSLLLTVLYTCVKNALPGLLHIVELSPKGYLLVLLGLCGKLLVKITALLLLLATIDFAFARWKHRRDLRMSKHDIKEEYKSREGDPRIRGRMRDLRRQMLRRTNSISKVRNADVVITNPTHIAVALSYEHGVSPAPQLVAKGAGEVAKQIRDLAGRYQIPVVQNPPLARALYREVDFEAYLPEKWFPQVAKILIWVYAMRQSRDRTAKE